MGPEAMNKKEQENNGKFTLTLLWGTAEAFILLRMDTFLSV